MYVYIYIYIYDKGSQSNRILGNEELLLLGVLVRTGVARFVPRGFLVNAPIGQKTCRLGFRV